jgi:hypothetical protein
MAASPDLDAGVIAGLLADDERRRVVAAVVLGARTLEEITAQAALPHERASRALARLVDAGLVVAAAGGGVELDTAAIQQAARTARARPERVEHAHEPAERRKVLDVFVRDGRITSIPASRSKRLVVLDWLVQDFEPGVRYPEPEVNERLAARGDDVAALRRYLVDEGMLDRAAGEYWRSGGTVT